MSKLNEITGKGNLPRLAAGIVMMFAAMTVTLGLSVATAHADGIIKLAASTKTRSIKVPLAKPTTFRTDAPFNEIVVGDPDLAIVTPLTDQSFYIVGSRKGMTGIALFNEERELIGSLDVEIGPDENQINEDLRAVLGESGVKASTKNGNVVISGKANSPEAAEKARKIARKFDEDAIDTIKVQSSTQVQLAVRFVEAQRNKTKELGLGLRGGKGRVDAYTGGYVTGNITNALVSGSLPFGQVITKLISHGLDVDVLVQALESRGVARRLAEPNLVALSGDKASFLAGGEFPFPVAAEDGKVTVEFKKFGVGLDFTPTVLENGMIHLNIAPEVSAIDNTSSVKFNDIEIPGLIVRRANTTVELRDGQSFVMAGLLQSNGIYDVRKFPWLGDLPILGALFRSSAYRKQETDLVIIVTPRLVKPLVPGTEIATPLDATAAPNDIDLFVDGKTEISRAQLRTMAETEAGILPAGHILDF
ncbi:MAG: type II and III secretion system protein family protein [Nitratireductor sp.]